MNQHKLDPSFFLHQWAGHDGHFESQIIVSHPPSLVYVQLNDPSMLCDHFMGAFRTHSYLLCYRRIERASNYVYDWLWVSCHVSSTYASRNVCRHNRWCTGTYSVKYRIHRFDSMERKLLPKKKTQQKITP